MATKSEVFSDGTRALWDKDSPETTVVVLHIHPEATDRYENSR